MEGGCQLKPTPSLTGDHQLTKRTGVSILIQILNHWLNQTTVNWAQLSNEYRANESGESVDSGESGNSGESGYSGDSSSRPEGPTTRSRARSIKILVKVYFKHYQ